jgi:hypothetical protein
MSHSIPTLLTRNLHEVFGENDPERRRTVIEDIFAEDALFHEPRGVHRGWDEIDRIAGAIKSTHPDFRYTPIRVSRPAEFHRQPLAGRVEDWRAGLGRCRATFPAPSTSNAACGFPALRSPICFTSRLIGPILPGRLSACRVALDSR